MTKQANNKHWEPTHLRITLFPTEEFKDNPQKLWPSIDGLSLEESKTKPKTFESVFEGSFNNLMVIMAVLPIKLDLIIKPIEPISIDSTTLPALSTLGKYSEALNNFNILAKSWVNQIDIDKFNRIAFGTELLRSVPNRDEGYKEISSLTPINVDAKDTNDFQLRINKPTKHKIQEKREIIINRLMTWGILKRSIGLGTLGELSTSYKYPETYFSHLILDINTAPNQGNFTKTECFDLFTSLIEYGIDISAKGIK